MTQHRPYIDQHRPYIQCLLYVLCYYVPDDMVLNVCDSKCPNSMKIIIEMK